MKSRKILGLISLMLLLSISASAQLEYWVLDAPQFDYHTEFIRVNSNSRGLTLSNFNDYLFFSVDKDNNLLTISLLKTDSVTKVQKSDPIVIMHFDDAKFSYVDPSRDRNLYYIQDNVFSAMVLKDGQIERNVRITVAPEVTAKGRRIVVSSLKQTVSTIWW